MGMNSKMIWMMSAFFAVLFSYSASAQGDVSLKNYAKNAAANVKDHGTMTYDARTGYGNPRANHFPMDGNVVEHSKDTVINGKFYRFTYIDCSPIGNIGDEDLVQMEMYQNPPHSSLKGHAAAISGRDAFYIVSLEGIAVMAIDKTSGLVPGENFPGISYLPEEANKGALKRFSEISDAFKR